MFDYTDILIAAEEAIFLLDYALEHLWRDHEEIATRACDALMACEEEITPLVRADAGNACWCDVCGCPHTGTQERVRDALMRVYAGMRDERDSHAEWCEDQPWVYDGVSPPTISTSEGQRMTPLVRSHAEDALA
jgi:hypothetical protein